MFTKWKEFNKNYKYDDIQRYSIWIQGYLNYFFLTISAKFAFPLLTDKIKGKAKVHQLSVLVTTQVDHLNFK
jgi:L-rhamnose mutarotase